MAHKKKIATKFSPRYKLEISQRQAELISNAVELYARLGGGQFKMLDHFFWNKKGALEKAHPHLDDLQLIKNGSLNAYPGIGQLDDDFRILYDIHQVVRYRLALDRKPDGKRSWSVDLRDPLQSCKTQPLAKMEKVFSK
jgi:hypothetical protein